MIEVRVSRELAVIARELKASGDRGLQREIRRGLRNGARPVSTAAKDAAREQLPHRGGLNDYIADGARFGVRTNLAAAHPTVRIVIGGKKDGHGHDMQEIDAGRLRHPTWKHGDRWVTQQIAPHIMTDAMLRAKPEARAELTRAIDEWARRFA